MMSVRDESYEAHEHSLERAPRASEIVESNREAHNARQCAVFDEKTAEEFDGRPLVEEVREKLVRIAEEATKKSSSLRILDVGAGSGALAALYGSNHKVTCIDLSKAMIERVAQKGFDVWQGDIIDYPESWFSEELEAFDVAVFNACFGNVFDQTAALDAAAEVVKPGGHIVVAHPLGADFVEDLHVRDPTVVRHKLPRSRDQMAELLKGETRFLKPAYIVDEADFYVSVYDRLRVAPLHRCLAVRGPVQRGYGRGSKKLGFPTANLPEGLGFQDALSTLPNGVYACYAMVGDEETVYEAVANVGFSPTFAGAENPTKIIEAYLIDRQHNKDFYDQPLSLFLIAFQRPERKWPSFDALVKNIRNDVHIAHTVLQHDPHLQQLKNHPAFRSTIKEPKDPSVLVNWVDLDDDQKA